MINLKYNILLILVFQIGNINAEEDGSTVFKKIKENPTDSALSVIEWGGFEIHKVERKNQSGAFGGQVKFYARIKGQLKILNDFAGPNFHELKLLEEGLIQGGRERGVILKTYSSGGVGSAGWVLIINGKLTESHFVIEGPISKEVKTVGVSGKGELILAYQKKEEWKIFTVPINNYEEAKNTFEENAIPVNCSRR